MINRNVTNADLSMPRTFQSMELILHAFLGVVMDHCSNIGENRKKNKSKKKLKMMRGRKEKMDEITQNNDDVEEICQLVKKSVKRILSEGNPMLRNVIVYKNHDRQEEDFRGTFHEWGISVLEWSKGACNFTQGIIEDSEGKVRMVCPELIKFEEKQNV